MPRLLEWLERVRPDVVCLQETKIAAELFPRLELNGLGYEVAAVGQGAWNGVALLSNLGISEITPGLAQRVAWDGLAEARAVGATCGGIRVWSVYVPNGREPGHAHYAYKLQWLAALRDTVAGELRSELPLAVCGDFNVAPTDADVWDPLAFVGSTHVTPAERDALAQVRALGLEDVIPRPLKYDRPFTYWDYRAGMFHKNMGMRIDLVLLSEALARSRQDAYIDRDMRKGSGPSDHAPVVVDLAGPPPRPNASGEA